MAASLNDLGNVSYRRGEYEEAELLYRRALEIRQRALGDDHPDVAATLANLGTLLESQGDHEQAALYYQRALRIAEKTLPPDHPDLTLSILGLADVALARRRPDVARAHAERAVSMLEGAKVVPDELAKARFTLARALAFDPAERSRARVLAEQARDAFVEHGKGREAELAEVQAWLTSHR